MADIPATTGPDNLIGTADDDIFSGTAGGANATLSSDDTIDGAGGIDAVDLTFDASGGMPEFSFANVSNVETLSVSDSNGFGQFTDLDNTITTVNVSEQGSVGLEFNGDSADTIALNLTNVTEANGQLATIDFDDIDTSTLDVTVSGTAAALGIANAGGGMQLGPDAVETLNINSVGDTANVLGVSGTSAITSLTLTGDQDITLVGGSVTAGSDPTNGIDPASEFNTATGFTALGTVDASGFTGNLTLDASNATGPITFFGGPGNAVFTSGTGNDQIFGGAGEDRIIGGAGDDQMFGGEDADTVGGGAGNDLLGGGAGDDMVYGAAGNDLVFGGAGNDQVLGDAGSDVIGAGSGSDTIYAGSENDIVYSGADDDVAYGGDGNDIVFGGAGDDTLYGGAGDDLLYGGAGADQFSFSAGSGNDVIVGFNAEDGDRLDLQGQTFTEAQTANGDVELMLSGGGTITLEGIMTFEDDFVA